MTERTREKPRHLGRGLEALLGPIKTMHSPSNPQQTDTPTGEEDASRSTEAGLHEVPLDAISANPYQARRHWDEEKLSELAQSIAANGIVQPIVVRRTPSGFQIIAGERRFRACQQLDMKHIPVTIREVSEEQMFELSLVENIHRSDLNPVERAKAYQSYILQYKLTQTEAASRLGEDRSVVSNYIRILELSNEVQKMVAGGQLSMGHAKAILALPTEALRTKLANRALAGRLSVRDVERIAKETLNGKSAAPAVDRSPPPHIRELEERLADRLGSRVNIKTSGGGQRGRVVIEFKSLDEFDNLLEIMGVQQEQGL